MGVGATAPDGSIHTETWYTGEFRPGVGSRSSSGLTEHYDRSADDQLLAIRCEAAQASAGLFPPPVPV